MTPRWVVYEEPAGGGGGGPWDPSQLSTLSGWWDASDSSTLFDATSGGSTPTHGTNVKRWEDKSGNGHHALQADNAGPKLQVTSNTLNSSSVVRFTRITNQLTTNMLEVAASSDFAPDLLSCMTVVRSTSNPGNSGVLGMWNPPTGANYWFLIHRLPTSLNVIGLRNSSDTANHQSPATTPAVDDNDLHLFGGSMNTGGNLGCFIDGSAGPTASQPDNRSGTTTLRIGSYGGNGTGFDGDIAEVVIWRSVSTADRENVEGYLAHKWGLAGNLPVSHPYKNAAP